MVNVFALIEPLVKNEKHQFKGVVDLMLAL